MLALLLACYAAADAAARTARAAPPAPPAPRRPRRAAYAMRHTLDYESRLTPAPTSASNSLEGAK